MDTTPRLAPAVPGTRSTLPIFSGDGDVRLFTRCGGIETDNSAAARVLAEHLFSRGRMPITGIEYAASYRLAQGMTGGDIVDVYRFDNNSAAFSIADISGKGSTAAIHAAMIKYGLRAYASLGLTPERILRALDRLYIENNAFERIESFASVFFCVIDASRRMMQYASGGHEAAAVVCPGQPARILKPTAPLIGVFDDQHSLFGHVYINLPPGAVFVATTDGITEARNRAGDFFGMDGFLHIIEEFAQAPTEVIVDALIENVVAFSGNDLHDDIAVIAARFP